MGLRTVSVVGLGYIGLPTATILAANDVDVIGVDVNQATVEAVNAGRVPFVEPDLGIMLAGAVSQRRLTATTTPEPADAFVIAVPTPFKSGHKADLSYIRAAATAIAPLLRGGELIVLESTSPPGTTRKLARWILGLRPDLSLDGVDGRPIIHLAYCPERVLPGRVLVELVENDRVLGGLTPGAAVLAGELYGTFCKGELVMTDATTAEMTKLVENAYRDVNIAFANELSIIADKLDVDVWELIRLANHHPRVDILAPGPGVGGHCIAVDPWFIVEAVPEQARLIRRARKVNNRKPEWVVKRVVRAVRTRGLGTVALFGLAFKPDIDDLRQSPAVQIVASLADALPDVELLVVEPHVTELPGELAARPNLRLTALPEAVRTAEARVVLVAHSAFRQLDDEPPPHGDVLTMSFAARTLAPAATVTRGLDDPR